MPKTTHALDQRRWYNPVLPVREYPYSARDLVNVETWWKENDKFVWQYRPADITKPASMTVSFSHPQTRWGYVGNSWKAEWCPHRECWILTPCSEAYGTEFWFRAVAGLHKAFSYFREFIDDVTNDEKSAIRGLSPKLILAMFEVGQWWGRQ